MITGFMFFEGWLEGRKSRKLNRLDDFWTKEVTKLTEDVK
jgi:hypothetical protein